ncbi:cysteine--tRNA ligase [Prosthecomicrobium pneumaticum]|uniref:Cysteine--tRNA ligase n=1 Tax=Prosthecomicrobium pneumaticum TaxID=81895 RepID=A0A7W9FMS4_9HYPH|nr:cysteine--tRNA ligase [Prosthecomicrobium pneumaticum]MBB5753557.1 cysteinyl-tRNA synthetase [Prosthecomicrobium pneumaticum]
MALRLYNTLSKAKDDFAPIDPENVRMYVCGPTVYDFAHIGNARPVIVFDVLFRLLRHLYGAEHVTYVRNITDVDDKINARAARDYPGLDLNAAIRKVTETTERQFHEDVDALGCLRPSVEPRATEYIAEMVEMIDRLVARGVAYVAEDHVLFSVAAMNARPGPRYGALARRSLDEMLAGARVDVAPYKRDAMDFVLWKPSKPGEPSWTSPAGIATPGRPGWHIECSAMSMAKLLAPYGGGLACDDPQKNVFDIHAGGIDLVFPHHENEIAQSCCALGTDRMANIWMHNGFLQVEGEKMSKSLGNFVTIREALGGLGGWPWPGAIVRFNMLKTQYRQPIDWTAKNLQESAEELFGWSRLLRTAVPSRPSEGFVAALEDDLNTPEALAELRRLARLVGEGGDGALAAGDELAASLVLFGFEAFVGQATAGAADYRRGLRDAVEQAWADADRQDRDRAAAAAGIDPATVESLLAARIEARRAKNFAESDRIRDELAAMGIVLKDGKDEATGAPVTTWEVKR